MQFQDATLPTRCRWLKARHPTRCYPNLHAVPYHTLPYPTLQYPTLPYLILPYNTLPYPKLYPALPYHTLPYPTLPSYHTLPYSTLPYLTNPTLSYVTLPTLPYPILPYPTIPHPTLYTLYDVNKMQIAKSRKPLGYRLPERLHCCLPFCLVVKITGANKNTNFEHWLPLKSNQTITVVPSTNSVPDPRRRQPQRSAAEQSFYKSDFQNYRSSVAE